MPRTSLFALSLAGLIAFAFSATAEIVAPVALEDGYESTAPTMEATSWIAAQKTDANGTAIVDADGQPVMELVATDTKPVVPGNTVVYEFAVSNPTDAPLENVALSSAFPAEMALDGASFAGPEGLVASFATAEEPDVWHQIYPLPPEAEREEMPSLDAIANLRVIVPEVPDGSKALVSYAAVVRQGITLETLESN